jgi:hypothetical protein
MCVVIRKCLGVPQEEAMAICSQLFYVSHPKVSGMTFSKHRMSDELALNLLYGFSCSAVCELQSWVCEHQSQVCELQSRVFGSNPGFLVPIPGFWPQSWIEHTKICVLIVSKKFRCLHLCGIWPGITYQMHSPSHEHTIMWWDFECSRGLIWTSYRLPPKGIIQGAAKS